MTPTQKEGLKKLAEVMEEYNLSFELEYEQYSHAQLSVNDEALVIATDWNAEAEVTHETILTLIKDE